MSQFYDGSMLNTRNIDDDQAPTALSYSGAIISRTGLGPVIITSNCNKVLSCNNIQLQ